MDELRAKIQISAGVTGGEKVDGLARSVDGVGAAAKQAQVDSAPAIAGFSGIGDAAEQAGTKAASSHRKISDGVKSISEQLSFLTSAYAAWQGAQSTVHIAADVGKTADAYNNLAARLKLVTGEGEAFRTSFAAVRQIALDTGSSVESTAALFTKLAQTGKDAGLASQQAIAQAESLTRTINQAVQLSGASAEASSAAIVQLVQGLQSGTLRGDEFNSVMEQSPRLARALADGLGTTTGKLREMAEAGALSSEAVIGALRGQAATLEAEFGKLPATIGRALENLKTQWTVYVGEQDAATGASAKAASAINALADNLNTVGSALVNVGQAYLGFKAYSIAAEFLAINAAVVAQAAATRAAATNWAAFGIAAQLAGKQAVAAGAEAASGATAAAAGATRLSAALSLLKGFSLAFLIANIVDVGKWLGETAAKAMGYGKAIEDAELKQRGAEKAARDLANELAAQAQKAKLAENAALGLSAVSLKLVADFDEARKKGESVARALEGLAKALDLSNVQGIREAGAALDALAVKGKISADQVRDAWQKALDGKDLQKFEVEARAAFDGSEQGVRRLAAALDAQLREALKRTGLDAGTLKGSINTAAVSALNDFDTLIGRVGELGKMGVKTGLVLETSLNNALKSASTEAAVQAVIERWNQLGQQGLVTGKQLADGLAAANAKLDEIKPGINSVAEAFAALGMKSHEELKKAADTAKEAWQTIKQSGVASAAELQKAFKAYAEAAIAANGGVASEMLKAEAAARGFTVEVDAAGQAMLKLAENATAAADKTGQLKGALDAAGGASTTVQRAVNSAAVDMGRLAAEAGVAADRVDLFTQKFNEFLAADQRPSTDFGAKFRDAAAAAKDYIDSLDRANDLTERLGQAAQGGAQGLAALVAEAEQAANGMTRLDAQDLGRLRSAIESAKQQMASLKDSAESTLRSLKEELAQLNGNFAEAERLRMATRRADLDSQLSLARAQGNLAAQHSLTEANATLDQIAAKKIGEARQREADELARTSQASGQAMAAASNLSNAAQYANTAASAVRSAATASVTMGGAAQQLNQAANTLLSSFQSAPSNSGGGAGFGGESSGEGRSGEPGGFERRSGDSGSRDSGRSSSANHVTNINIAGVLDVNDRATLEALTRKLAPHLSSLARRA